MLRLAADIQPSSYSDVTMENLRGTLFEMYILILKVIVTHV